MKNNYHDLPGWALLTELLETRVTLIGENPGLKRFLADHQVTSQTTSAVLDIRGVEEVPVGLDQDIIYALARSNASNALSRAFSRLLIKKLGFPKPPLPKPRPRSRKFSSMKNYQLDQRFLLFINEENTTHIINTQDKAAARLFFEELSSIALLRPLRVLPTSIKLIIIKIFSENELLVMRKKE